MNVSSFSPQYESNFPNILDNLLNKDSKTSSPVSKKADQKTQKIAKQHINENEKKVTWQDLIEKIIDLSPEIQEKIQDQQAHDLSEVSGFSSQFVLSNETYNREKDLQKALTYNNYYNNIRESQQKDYQRFCRNFDETKKLCQQRIDALHNSIFNHRLEQAVLRERQEGKKSYWETWFSCSRYGAPYRLWETQQALEARKIALNITSPDPTENDFDFSKLSGENLSIREKVVRVSRKIDVLKEEISLFNEALKEVKACQLPQIYYDYHCQRFNSLKDKIQELNDEVKTRLNTLQKEIKMTSAIPHYPQSLDFKQEEAEINTRWQKIFSRKEEIETLLQFRKKEFALRNVKEEKKANLPHFSKEDKESYCLLKRIIELKEDVILGKNWEQFANEEDRIKAYQEAVKRYHTLFHQHTTWCETKKEREKKLNMEIETYQSYINRIELGVKKIENCFSTLEKAASERAKWQVNRLTLTS